MSRTGNPYDNAKAESFMKTLKSEEVYLRQDRDHRRSLLVTFLEEVYNASGCTPPWVTCRQRSSNAMGGLNQRGGRGAAFPYDFFKAWGNLSLRLRAERSLGPRPPLIATMSLQLAFLGGLLSSSARLRLAG